ncbi:phosphotransferase enzyme family protein [Sarocladium implicatum]|nr:phosphotransferase enzyme family protein [Sarocladium implicatum]
MNSGSQSPSSLHESLDHSQDDDPAESFQSVLSCLDKSQIVPLVRDVRKAQDPAVNADDGVIGEAKYGSFHVLFPVEFPDGQTWLAKIPMNGSLEQWNDLSAAALTSEANTMRMLKRETTVPVPAVLDFSSTTDNVLRCPYIIISHVPGRSLYDGSQGIASAMAQLSSYDFSRSGSPKFDTEGQVMPEVGPIRFLDNVGMLDRWFIHQDPSDDPMYVEIQPFGDSKDHYRFPLELHPPRHEEPDPLIVVLRQLIEWLPEPRPESLESKPFVLAHPDFDIQNFLVSDDGELQAILDWDGICAVPRSVGNQSLPGWLTRDWDPDMYGYVESMEQGEQPVGVWEDSPAELARYRGIYRGLMQEHLGSVNSEGNKIDSVSISLIAENLAIAAREPVCRHGILEKMVTEIARITNGQFEMDLLDLAAKMTDGDLGEEVLEALRTGFLEMVEKASSL